MENIFCISDLSIKSPNANYILQALTRYEKSRMISSLDLKEKLYNNDTEILNCTLILSVEQEHAIRILKDVSSC